MLSPQQSIQTTGNSVSIDGKNEAKVEALQDKCNKMACSFATCPVSGADIRQGYNSLFCPSIRYSLPATAIASATLKKMQNKVIEAILPQLGYNRKFPRAVTYAPEHFGGLDILSLDVEQGIAHAISLIGHIRADTSLGQHLMTLLESYQVSTGLSGNPLQHTVNQEYIPSPWIQTLREFLQTTKSTIRLPHLAILCPIWKGDKCIMECVVKTKLFTTAELRVINNCRVYLQVTYLSEITTSDGVQILNKAFEGNEDANLQPTLWRILRSKILWPLQPRPYNAHGNCGKSASASSSNPTPRP
jgi:hypothetical protein